jgi:hypothetical protein
VNSFGVYKFTDVPAASVLVPDSTRYRFTPLVLNITEDLRGVDFIAETVPRSKDLELRGKRSPDSQAAAVFDL